VIDHRRGQQAQVDLGLPRLVRVEHQDVAHGQLADVGQGDREAAPMGGVCGVAHPNLAPTGGRIASFGSFGFTISTRTIPASTADQVYVFARPRPNDTKTHCHAPDLGEAGYDFVFGSSFHRADLGEFISDLALAAVGHAAKLAIVGRADVFQHAQRHQGVEPAEIGLATRGQPPDLLLAVIV